MTTLDVKETINSKKTLAPKEAVEPIDAYDPKIYDGARIPYSAKFVGDTLNALLANRLPSDRVRPCIIDMGAGTGMLGDTILQLGYKGLEAYPQCDVIFIEPNSESVKFLEKKYAGNPRVRILQASAEDEITLPKDIKADAMFIGDAAHWMTPEALPKIRSVITLVGRIAAFSKYWSQESPLTTKIDELLRDECGNDYEKSTNKLKRDSENLDRRHGTHLMRDGDKNEKTYYQNHAYSQQELLNYFRSLSFSSRDVQENEERFKKNVIEKLWEYAKEADAKNPKKKLLTFDGKLVVPYEINVSYRTPRMLNPGADMRLGQRTR